MKTGILNGIEGKRKEKMRQIMEEAQLLKVQKEVIIISLFQKNNCQMLNFLKLEEQCNNKSKNETIRAQHALWEEKKKLAEV